MNATSYLFLLKLMRGGGLYHIPTIRCHRGQVGLAPPPSLLPENRVTLSPAPGKAYMPQRVDLGKARCCVVMESIAATPCPVGGHG